MERNKKSSDKTKEFVEKYWPEIALGATVVGATIWLVARLIKERKDKSSKDYQELTLLENEAVNGHDETSILLETGSRVSQIAGSEISTIKDELTPHLADEKAKSTLEVLNNFSEMDGKKKRK